MEIYDVIIVGAGPVGLCMSLALGQQGFQTLLIHDNLLTRDEKDDGRAYALSPSSSYLLRHLGLGDILTHASEPMWDIIVSSGPGVHQSYLAWPSCHFSFTQESSQKVKDEPLAWLVEAHSLHNALIEKVHQMPHIHRRLAKKREHLSYEKNCLSLQLEEGEHVNCRLLINAEGRRGQLTKALGVSCFEKSYQQTALVGTLRHPFPHHGLAHEYFLSTGPFALLPITHDRTSFVWVEKTPVAQALIQGDRGFLKEELNMRVGDCLGPFELVDEHVRHYPLTLKLASRLVGERFCLIGDCAHVIHPLAGQGLNLGLRDVAALIEVLSEARDLGLDFSDPFILERYENWRWTDIASLVTATHGFNHIFSSSLPFLRPIQTWGLGIFDKLSFLKRFVIHLASGQQGDIPRFSKPPNDGFDSQRVAKL